MALSSVRDENKWNQRKIAKVAKIHHMNQVFSINGITTCSCKGTHKGRILGFRLITTTKVAWQSKF